VIVVLILFQIILGFATLGTGSQAIALIHFVNALAIFGATISGTFLVLRWNQMARVPKLI
jgi:flagellar motor component MotA